MADEDKEETLDDILGDIEGFEAKPDEKPPEAPDDEREARFAALEDRLAKAEERDEANSQRVLRGDIMDAVAKVKTQHPALDVLPDNVVRGWLVETATGDERIETAWQSRADNPEQFGKVLDAMGKQLSESITAKFDSRKDEETAQREAANAMVRSANGEQPEDESIPPQSELSAMTSAELRALEKKLVG